MKRIGKRLEVGPGCRWILASRLLAALIVVGCGAPKSAGIPEWDASDETSLERIDHSAWQDILDGYVETDPSGVNLVDYAALQKNGDGVATLANYLERLQQLEPRDHSRAEQRAYWINLYNALTLWVVLDAYPVDSIRDIHRGVIPNVGPWDDVHANVAGRDLTLNDIEHGILRPIWRDSRIHYAVNCAAYGCPHVMATTFTAANTETLLDGAARTYVNHPRGVDWVDDDLIVISSLYEWYVEDFGGTRESVIEHLVEYADAPLAARLERFEGRIDYQYDWRLNQP